MQNEQAENSRELPKYKCHKEVWALKIISIKPTEPILRSEPYLEVEEPYGRIFPGRPYFEKHNPQPGGYWVRYEDGYESYSPAAAFESGYTLIKSLILALCLLTAGTARAQLAWPTICAPAHNGVPEQCATISPDPGASFNTGGTTYDPTTGYRAPDAVVIAWAAQGDALAALGYSWGLWHNGLAGMTLAQVNAIVWVAASIGDRDALYGTHQRWAPLRAWVWPDSYAATRCGPHPSARCAAAFKFAAVTEYTSSGIDVARPGLSYAQLEAIFQIALGR